MTITKTRKQSAKSVRQTCCCLLLYVFLLPTITFALPSDRDKPMHLIANSADLNKQLGQGIFLGDVTLNQGSSHLHAARAVVKSDTTQHIKQAIAYGSKKKQAHFWTTVDVKKPILHAYADTITYYPKQHKIHLRGHALIKQGKDFFKAPFIVYDIANMHVISSSNKSEQTTIVIHQVKNKKLPL